MKNQSLFFLLYFLPCFVIHLFSTRPAGAIQIGDKIEIPINVTVYRDDGAGCGHSPDLSCTMGLGDRIEILEIKDSGDLFIVKYFPGNKRWKEKCQPTAQNFCFYSDNLKIFRAYSALEPRIEAVTKSEEPSKELLGDYDAEAMKGRIFSVYEHPGATPRFYDCYSRSSLEFIVDAGRRHLLNREGCNIHYGYRLKIVGFGAFPRFAYVRVMKPEYEKQVVKYEQYYSCPVKSLFRADIYRLIEGETVYKESLKLREDFLKVLLSSRLEDNLFELPLTVDGLTVGQNALVRPPDKERVVSIQNIDFEYLLGQERNDLGQFEDLLRKRPEEIKSLVEDLNPLFFKTIPMINHWYCHNIGSVMTDSNDTFIHFGRIIGFTKINSGLSVSRSLPNFVFDLWRSSFEPEWFAIVENETVSRDDDWKFLSCKFVLIPTSVLLTPSSFESKYLRPF